MTRIVFAWEMGGGFGHLGTIIPLLQRLKNHHNCQIFLILKEIHNISSLIEINDNISILPAPFISPQTAPPAHRPPPPINYADEISMCGYNNAQQLATLMRCWHTLYDLIMPDLVISEAAPTALLTARNRNIPTATLGQGYNIPPKTSPMPSISPTPEGITPEMLMASEARTLAIINEALAILHHPPLKTFADLIAADLDILASLPEIDAYGARENTVYSGPLYLDQSGENPAWPATSGKKIFGYIKPDHPLFIPTLQALRTLPYPALIVSPKASQDVISKFSLPHLRIQSKNVKFSEAIKQSDIVISHASHGTVAAAFTSGKIQLALPGQLEQLMVARRLVNSGTGLLVHKNGTAAHIVTALRDLADRPEFATRADAYAQLYKNYDPVKQAEIIADKLYTVATRPDPI